MNPILGHQEEKDVHTSHPLPVIEDGSSGGSFDKDIAATIVSEHAQSIDPDVDRRVLRKIDLYLIPLMWIGYGFVYYDKACHSTQITGSKSLTELCRRSWEARSFSEWQKTSRSAW